MKHYGDITKLSGYDLPVVDVITGGSPCQDLSVAGKRAGLDGERSELFMEQVRIVKEMRERDKADGRTDGYIRPRYMVWENVAGAFSSNKGKDFQTVLTEIVRIADPDAPDVPMPEKRWDKAGCLYDEMGRWSIAWRIHDAQFWGVPQRRKRLALVVDFGGLSAPEVLFERKGLRWHPDESIEEGEKTPRRTGKSIEEAGELEVLPSIRGGEGGNQKPVVYDGSRRYGYEPFGDVSETVQAQYGTGGNNTQIVVEPTMIEMTSTKNTIIEDGTCPTLTARMGTGGNQVNAVCMDVGFFQTNEEKAGALLARQYKDPPVTYQNRTGALMASGYEKLGTQEAANDMYVTGSVVRRLTPLECERLQGFPDHWTDIGEWVDSNGKKHKEADSPRYKALGNSIALPFWQYLARRICAQYERDITMGSLFDGIGGFPLVFERCGAKAVWASEIEEFPIAVTKLRFPE